MPHLHPKSIRASFIHSHSKKSLLMKKQLVCWALLVLLMGGWQGCQNEPNYEKAYAEHIEAVTAAVDDGALKNADAEPGKRDD